MPKVKPKLDWTEVDSSNVSAVAFIEPKKLIAVRFNSGGLYTYEDADNDMYVSLVHAESVGKYLNQVVKVYCPYTKWNNEADLIAFISR